MSNLLVNIRFFQWHLMIERGCKVKWVKNKEHKDNGKKFEVYDFFGWERKF